MCPPSPARWSAPSSPRSADCERHRHAHDRDPRSTRTKVAGQVYPLRAEKLRRRARTRLLCGLIRAVSAACAASDAAQGEKHLSGGRIQAILTSEGRPLGECRYNERFNGTLRNEVLNVEWFHTVHQAQTAINVWLRQYNHIRPHHGLNMRPPVPETLIEITKISGTENWG